MRSSFFLKSIAILFSLIIFAFNGCKSNVVGPVNSGEVHGRITYVDSDSKTVGLPGIKIYLMNTSFKPDTLNYNNNVQAIVDSTVTDSSGNYIFANLKYGNYGVAPIPSTYAEISYDSLSPDSYLFSVNSLKQSFTVNFKAVNPLLAQSGAPFSFTLRFKNLPVLENGWSFLFSINRVEYLVFIPSLQLSTNFTLAGDSSKINKPFNFYYDYGYTCLFYTLSNKFDFEFTEVTLDSTYQNVYKNDYKFSYDLTLSSCPAYSVFEYDWTAHTFTRIQ